MMRKILVLDAFTNGHEAALAFIRRLGWLLEECELVFCGTFARLLGQLAVGSVYAVVPVYNSTIKGGDITEVTEPLTALREKGCILTELDRLNLPVDHHLLAHRDVKNAGELWSIRTYPRAFEQCQKYLDGIKVPLDRRIPCESTGDAARIVSQLDSDMRAGAIASRLAAEAYDLRVLAERIQDDPGNMTTFVLLRHKT